MKLVIAGGTGFIGSHLVRLFLQQGHKITIISRDARHVVERFGSSVYAAQWKGELAQWINGADVLLSFVGSSIAEGRWTAPRKAEIVSSRLKPTQALVKAIARVSVPPRVFVSASAIGYYGNRGDEELTEDSSSGSGFLAELCQQWEEAALAASQQTRVVCLRLGVVLGKEGGMLAKLLPLVQHLGAVIPGSGRQWLSWITVDEIVDVVQWLLQRESLVGPVNVVAPHPVRMEEFMRLLARHFRKPVWFHVPAGLLHIVLGEMASTLIASQRVIPQRLQSVGYQFRIATLDQALTLL